MKEASSGLGSGDCGTSLAGSWLQRCLAHPERELSVYITGRTMQLINRHGAYWQVIVAAYRHQIMTPWRGRSGTPPYLSRRRLGCVCCEYPGRLRWHLRCIGIGVSED